MPAPEPPAGELYPENNDDAQARRMFDRRLRLFPWGVGVGMIVLGLGLADVQLFRHEAWLSRGLRQQQRDLQTPAMRGRILDREGRILAETRVTTQVGLDLGALRREFFAEERAMRASLAQGEDFRSPGFEARARVIERHLRSLVAGTAFSPLLDREALRLHLRSQPALPFPLVPALDPAQRNQLGERIAADPALVVSETQSRSYPNGHYAAHVLGRVKDAPVPKGTVGAPALMGDFGVEASFDALLQGRAGHQGVTVDVLGQPARPAELISTPVPGADLTLSLDLDLQRAATDAFLLDPAARQGSATVLDVRTGEVLALVSLPDFDPNALSPAIPVEEKARLDLSGAWLNRAVQATYPPGSSFKPYALAAALRAGVVTAGTVYSCEGYMQIGARRFHCHNLTGHGRLDLTGALVHSCNCWLYQAGLTTGAPAIAAEARRFRLDAPTGIELPGETTRALVPDPLWKTKQRFGPWTEGDTANLAIGQGYLRFSPLQAACAMASLARGETVTRPTLLFSPGRKPWEGFATHAELLDPESRKLLGDALVQSVAFGVARGAQVPGVTVAGKTGTAQIESPQGMRNIAWFVGYAPADAPRIAFAIALEGTEPNREFSGGEHAAPIAATLVARWADKTAP